MLAALFLKIARRVVMETLSPIRLGNKRASEHYPGRLVSYKGGSGLTELVVAGVQQALTLSLSKDIYDHQWN